MELVRTAFQKFSTKNFQFSQLLKKINILHGHVFVMNSLKQPSGGQDQFCIQNHAVKNPVIKGLGCIWVFHLVKPKPACTVTEAD